MFGDDNHRKLDLQVEALKGDIDVTADEFYEDYNDDEQSAINEAIMWLDGESDEKPSSGWDNFKKKSEAARDTAKVQGAIAKAEEACRPLTFKRQQCACQRQPSAAPKRGKKS